MAVLKVILIGTQSLPDPLNVAMEVSAFSGNKHKIYLFDPSLQLIRNGGGVGTTDWVDPIYGVANIWEIIQPV